MIKDLHCRLRAYAKLTANIQGGGGSGDDDFLKKIITSNENNLIDLGYRDAKSNRKVYALRRYFFHRVGDHVETVMKLGKNIDSLFYFDGTGKVDTGRYTGLGKISDLEDFQLVVGDNEMTISFYNDHNATDAIVDIYYVFTGTKDELTYSDVGDVTIEER